MLKLFQMDRQNTAPHPAAFRRLCVETDPVAMYNNSNVPAAFRRLCVETVFDGISDWPYAASRLQAAVC